VRGRFVLVLLLFPCALDGQVVRGRIVDVAANQPIRLAVLELLDDRGDVQSRAESDSTGSFRLRGWLAAKYRVRATALGYQPVTSDLLEVGTGDEFELTIRLAPAAVPIDPITVVSRSRSSLTEIALKGYLDRRDAGRRIGMGRFLDRGEIEERGTRLTDVLRRVPGLRIVRSGACVFIAVTSNPTGTNRFDQRASSDCRRSPTICPANIYLDGMMLAPDQSVQLDQMVPLDWVEAIEVYRRPAELPAEFLSSGACGVVALWTRRG
jgi:hypothetical protein